MMKKPQYITVEPAWETSVTQVFPLLRVSSKSFSADSAEKRTDCAEKEIKNSPRNLLLNPRNPR
jgi:hypothetical protein